MANSDSKLFVGQIPKSLNEDNLRPLFSQFGNIVELSIIRDKPSGSHKGCAFLTYSSRDEANTCIASLHNKHTLPTMTNPMQVRFAGSETEKHDNKLFIGMVPKTATNEELIPIFLPFGEIEELSLLKGPDGVSKGCAFLRYRHKESAVAAIAALNGGLKMTGSPAPLVVKFADSDKQKQQKQTQQQQLQQLSLLTAAGLGLGNPLAAHLAAANQNALLAAAGQQHGLTWDHYAQLGQLGLSPYLAAAGYPLGYGSGAAAGQGGSGVTGPPGAASLYGYPQAYGLGMGMGMGMGGLGSSLGLSGGLLPAAGSTKEGPPGANLFIYHLPKEYSDLDMITTFSQFGNVLSAKVFVDKDTGMSRCFGFVSYDNADSAAAAIAQMNGFQIGNKRLKVQLKTSRSIAGVRPY